MLLSFFGEPIYGQKNSARMKVISALHVIRFTSLLFIYNFWVNFRSKSFV